MKNVVRTLLPIAAMSVLIASAAPALADPDAAVRSDRWLTSGPVLQLAGPGQVNPQLSAGTWVADPQDNSTMCSVLQTVLVNPPIQVSDQLSTGKAGRPLEVQIQPATVLAKLSGNCLWQRQS